MATFSKSINPSVVLMTMCLFLILASRSSFAQIDSLLYYEGNFRFGNFSTDLSLKITAFNDQADIYFSSPDQNAYDIPSTNVLIKDDSIRFTLQSDHYRYNFAGISNTDQQLDMVLTVNEETFALVLNKVVDSEKGHVKSRDVRFRSDNLLLYGTIYYPEHPNGKAIYFVTSSGDQDRSATRYEAIKLAKKGYLTFHADKRGTGMSDGNWQEASIPELCKDDVRAVIYLAESNQIAYSNIGIKGSSQGASKVPYILSELPELGFGILVSCPGSTLLESDLNYWKNRHGLSLNDNDLKEAENLQRSIFEYIAGDLSQDSVRRQIEGKQAMPWFNAIWIPDLVSVQTDRKLTYSPLPYIKNVQQPVLVIQGNADLVIPANSLEVLKGSMGNKNAECRFVRLGEADHSMMFKGESDFKYWPSLHPEYWPTILQWLKELPNN